MDIVGFWLLSLLGAPDSSINVQAAGTGPEEWLPLWVSLKRPADARAPRKGSQAQAAKEERETLREHEEVLFCKVPAVGGAPCATWELEIPTLEEPMVRPFPP